jgi:hypothetical protein
MSQNDDASKQGRKAVAADALIKPSEKDEVTLTETELDRVSGGVGASYEGPAPRTGWDIAANKKI